MLKTPRNGWSEITIGHWKDRCSYLDDVPYILLEAFDQITITHNPACVKFDAEGLEYIIVFDIFETHIITCDCYGNWQHADIDIYIENLIEDFISDIRRDIDAWSEWSLDEDENQINHRKEDLIAWCNALESRL